MAVRNLIGREFKLPPYLLLLFPAVTLMLVMYAYPFITSFTRSAVDAQGNLTFANYIKTWALYRQDVFFTFSVTVFSTTSMRSSDG